MSAEAVHYPGFPTLSCSCGATPNLFVDRRRASVKVFVKCENCDRRGAAVTGEMLNITIAGDAIENWAAKIARETVKAA